jgi:hypothetical protein
VYVGERDGPVPLGTGFGEEVLHDGILAEPGLP